VKEDIAERGVPSMPAQWDRPTQTNEELATFDIDRSWGAHGHDRIHGDDPVPGVSSTIAMSGDNEDVEVDITAGQKMVSAMSGSLLTSLLGESRDKALSFARTDIWK
jgi:solute carrier family 25 protein 39/40